MELSKKEYADYLNRKSRNSSLFKNILCAFFIGGIICTIGQGIFDIYKNVFNMNEDTARICVSVTLVFVGALLTGLDIYGKIAKYAGAGTIVPITGFANAIVSPAMEFKKEGLVLGLAAKMFVIAGPVLVYGIASSAAVGVIYYIIGIFGGGV